MVNGDHDTQWYLWSEMAIAILCVFVYAPSTLYYYIKFKYLDNLIVIQKRYPHLTFHLCKAVMIYLMITVPLFMLSKHHIYMMLFGENMNIPYQILIRIQHIIFPITHHAIVSLLALRCWLTFFDLNWTMADRNSVWKYHLNPALTQLDFFLKHKDTLGSYSYTKKIQFAIFSLFSITTVTLFQFYLMDRIVYIHIHLLNAILFMIPSISITIFWFKTTKCINDNFFIRSEFKVISIITALHLCINLSALIIMIISPNLYLWASNIALFSTATSFWLLSLASTMWIRAKIVYNIKRFNTQSASGESFTLDIGFLFGEFAESKKYIRTSIVSGKDSPITPPTRTSLDSYSNYTPTRTVDDDDAKEIRVFHVMGNYDTFQLFINHLSKEFCVELMLCLVTIVQWKFVLYYIYQNSVNKDGKYVSLQTEQCCHECIISHDIPGNAITLEYFAESNSDKHIKFKEFSNDEFMIAVKKSAFDIYKKYVKAGAALEVNISASLRSKVAKICENLQCDELLKNEEIGINDLFCVFDCVGEEQYKLMAASFTRFRKCGDWWKVVDILSKDALFTLCENKPIAS